MYVHVIDKIHILKYKKGEIIMAVRDYREMYISTILAMSKNNQNGTMINRSYLAKLSFDELKELAQKLQR